MNSTNDCDIHFQMNQFNESTMNKIDDCINATNNGSPAPQNQAKPSTLVLKFSHSSNPCTATVSNDDDTINSPLDIYKQFGMRFMAHFSLFLFCFRMNMEKTFVDAYLISPKIRVLFTI